MCSGLCLQGGDSRSRSLSPQPLLILLLSAKTFLYSNMLPMAVCAISLPCGFARSGQIPQCGVRYLMADVLMSAGRAKHSAVTNHNSALQ